MTKEQLTRAIVSRLPLLHSLPPAEIPTPDQARAWIDGAFREVSGCAICRKSWPKGATDKGAETFWRLLLWEFGAGNLSGIYRAQWIAPDPDTFAKAQTLATVCAVYSGRRTASDRWREALHG